MTMYKKTKPAKTGVDRNESYIGETIEQKIGRVVNNKEPITDGAPLIYTERKEGVQPGYDIRTDRWDVALDAMDKVAATEQAKREAKIVEMGEKNKDKTADNKTVEGDKAAGSGGGNEGK